MKCRPELCLGALAAYLITCRRRLLTLDHHALTHAKSWETCADGSFDLCEARIAVVDPKRSKQEHGYADQE
jgi:hypothetical protein